MSSTANPDMANYGVEIEESGQKLRWESGLTYATVLLGDDPVAEAVAPPSKHRGPGGAPSRAPSPWTLHPA